MAPGAAEVGVFPIFIIFGQLPEPSGTFRGTLGTQDHTSIGSKTSLGHSMDPKMDPIIFEKISRFLRKFWLFLFLIFDIGPLILPLSNSTNAQWTSWTFRDPQMDPQMNPARLISGALGILSPGRIQSWPKLINSLR